MVPIVCWVSLQQMQKCSWWTIPLVILYSCHWIEFATATLSKAMQLGPAERRNAQGRVPRKGWARAMWLAGTTLLNLKSEMDQSPTQDSSCGLNMCFFLSLSLANVGASLCVGRGRLPVLKEWGRYHTCIVISGYVMSILSNYFWVTFCLRAWVRQSEWGSHQW